MKKTAFIKLVHIRSWPEAGVKEYKDLLANTKANQTRLKTATEWSMKGMSETDNFGSSLLRNVLAALINVLKEKIQVKEKIG